MTKQFLENVLDLTLGRNTIIFSFPGIGIGNTYPDLSGCSLEVREMEKIAKTFQPLGIDFIGISTGKLPEESSYIKYIDVKKDIKSFKYISKNNEIFIDRFTLFIHDDTIIEYHVNDIYENAMKVKEWIKNMVYKA